MDFRWAWGGAPVIANLATGRSTGAGEDRLIAIEDLYGGLGADVLIGDGRANRLVGGHEERDGDVIHGRGGADVVGHEFDSGRDRLFGDRGSDKIFAGPGNDRAWGGPGDDLIIGAAVRVILPTDGDDTFSGGPGDDSLRGGLGDDGLSGNRGDDRLRGERGADTLDGGRGRDLCRGGPDRDTANACERFFGIP